MANVIRVSPEILREQAAALRGCSARIGDAFDGIKNETAFIEESWQGEAATAFIGNIKEFENFFTSFQEYTDSLSTILNQFADTFVEVDQSISAAILN